MLYHTCVYIYIYHLSYIYIYTHTNHLSYLYIYIILYIKTKTCNHSKWSFSRRFSYLHQVLLRFYAFFWGSLYDIYPWWAKLNALLLPIGSRKITSTFDRIICILPRFDNWNILKSSIEGNLRTLKQISWRTYNTKHGTRVLPEPIGGFPWELHDHFTYNQAPYPIEVHGQFLLLRCKFAIFVNTSTQQT